MNKEVKEILDNPKILMLSYGNYISLDDYAKLKDYITNLQEEIEDLKVDYGSKAQVERDILQDKIDKAIEYINNLYNDEYISYGNKEEMLNILKGEDNE